MDGRSTIAAGLPPATPFRLPMPEEIRLMLPLTHTLCLPISSPANSAAPSLWREMDKSAVPRPYANCSKKVLPIRHKTGCRSFMLNAHPRKEKPGAPAGLEDGFVPQVRT
jgi:hypothetical protein